MGEIVKHIMHAKLITLKNYLIIVIIIIIPFGQGVCK
jgi:hypothetical protein